MKTRRIPYALLALTVLAAAPLAMAEDSKSAKAPAADEAKGGARIEFTKDTINLGEVVKGETAAFTFEFKNTGTEELEIKQAKPSCGCTVADFSRNVKPGGTGTVVARVDTARFKGPITKTVTVTSNDPVNSTVHLQAKANVKALVDVSPSEHVYFRIYRGDDVPTKRVLTITSDSDNPLTISKVDSSNPSVTTNLTNLKKDGQDADKGASYQLEVDVKKDAPLGPLTGIITLTTSHTKVPTLSLNVNGQVLGDVVITPQKVYLGQVTKSTASAVKRTVRIERRKGDGFRIEKIETSSPSIKAEIAPVEDGKIYTLTISVADDLAAGAINANVLVKTNDTEQPTIEIPVIGTVRG